MSAPLVVLITAGSAGLGAATARVFAKAGMRVIINYSSNGERANTLIEELHQVSPLSKTEECRNFVSIRADLSKKSDIGRLVTESVSQMGKLDAVFSNGGWTSIQDFNDLDDNVDEEMWDKCWNMNVKSHLWLMHAAKKYLDESEGAFITTASLAGVRPSGSSLSASHHSHPAGAIVEIISQPTSIADQYLDQAKANPENHRYCAENAYINDDADVTTVLEKAFTTLPHRKSFALWFSMAPTSKRPLPDMACSMQSDHYFALYTVWENAEDDVRCKGWVKDIMKDVAPLSKGAYLGDSDFQVRKTKFWTDEAAEKLMNLRRKWDPKGTVSGYLDDGDISGTKGLDNQNWSKI